MRRINRLLPHESSNKWGRAGRLIIMSTPLEKKSTLEEIKKRFDHDVKRFSNLKTGQTSDGLPQLQKLPFAGMRPWRVPSSCLTVGDGQRKPFDSGQERADSWS